MKKLALYAAAAAVTMSITAPISSQAAVRMFVTNGNSNGMYSGGCNSQGMNLSDILSSLCQNSFSCGNPSSTLDILQPNLPSQNCQNQNLFGQSCPDILYPNINQNCWNQYYPDNTQNCPNQNCPDETPDCPGQNCPDETPDCWGSNCPDQNQPGQNWPGQNQPSQNQPSQPSQGDSTNSTYAQQVISLVNEERAKAGLAPLNEAANVTQAANVRAQEIVRSFSHTRPDGSSFSSVLQQNGVSYRGAGENIAYGQRTAAEVMDGWMNSSGHRANILNANYTNIGVGFYESNGVKYWVQLFTY